ncbi:MAG: DUF3127 domain-containing protein [Flavobacteriaceae bacterium]|nr:DUF3127 domain-containing protein [Flavobacteriaceae bacterium]
MEVLGRIKVIGQPQQVNATFRKRELVVTTDEQYPQTILIEFTQDKVDLLNSFQIGEPVRVSINLRGREWTNPQGEVRYFNTIQGWRIERDAPAQQMGQPMQDQYQQQGYNNQMPQQGMGQPMQNQGMQQQGFNNQGQQGMGQPMQNQQMGQPAQGQFGQQQNQQYQQQNQYQYQQQAPGQFPPANQYNEEDHDDLPF